MHSQRTINYEHETSILHSIVHPENNILLNHSTRNRPITNLRISTVSNLISRSFGDSAIQDRYAQARQDRYERHPGVHDGEVFLDIGSGDGALVLNASLLYANDVGNAIQKAIGLEIVPGLVDRSIARTERLKGILQTDASSLECSLQMNQSQIQFHLGDVHNTQSETISNVLSETHPSRICFV